jgi:hypothetical protein
MGIHRNSSLHNRKITFTSIDIQTEPYSSLCHMAYHNHNQAKLYVKLDILLTVYHYVSQQHNQLNTFTFTNTLLCLNPLHVLGFKHPSSGGTTLAVFGVSWVHL